MNTYRFANGYLGPTNYVPWHHINPRACSHIAPTPTHAIAVCLLTALRYGANSTLESSHLAFKRLHLQDATDNKVDVGQCFCRIDKMGTRQNPILRIYLAPINRTASTGNASSFHLIPYRTCSGGDHVTMHAHRSLMSLMV